MGATSSDFREIRIQERKDNMGYRMHIAISVHTLHERHGEIHKEKESKEHDYRNKYGP